MGILSTLTGAGETFTDANQAFQILHDPNGLKGTNNKEVIADAIDGVMKNGFSDRSIGELAGAGADKLVTDALLKKFSQDGEVGRLEGAAAVAAGEIAQFLASKVVTALVPDFGRQNDEVVQQQLAEGQDVGEVRQGMMGRVADQLKDLAGSGFGKVAIGAVIAAAGYFGGKALLNNEPDQENIIDKTRDFLASGTEKAQEAITNMLGDDGRASSQEAQSFAKNTGISPEHGEVVQATINDFANKNPEVVEQAREDFSQNFDKAVAGLDLSGISGLQGTVDASSQSHVGAGKTATLER